MTKALLVVMVLLFAVPVFAQTSTPTPVPTVIIPSGEISDVGQSAQEGLSSVNNSITAPDGTPLLPNETGATIFGYAKWLTDPVTADQVMGPFAPLIVLMGLRLALEFALLAIYVVVYIAVYGVRWIIWIVRFILQIIQTAAAAASGVVGFLLGFIGL